MSTKQYATTAINGCGILVPTLQSAELRVDIPLDMSGTLTAKPSGTLCTARVVVMSMPSCGGLLRRNETPMAIPSENEWMAITATIRSALRASTPSTIPTRCTSSPNRSSTFWLSATNAAPASVPKRTPCHGVTALQSSPSRAYPSPKSAQLAAHIMPAASALARPIHHSETPLHAATGRAPSPVDSAVTQPYHHTWAMDRPPYMSTRTSQADSTVTAARQTARKFRTPWCRSPLDGVIRGALAGAGLVSTIGDETPQTDAMLE
mmetsp:Transcript_6249/g.14493  ORF Transcript_6249/g.14493 Transcript_6249/m.14493 type:complete len:264 (+) Transcript_6249:508-1299(+)